MPDNSFPVNKSPSCTAVYRQLINRIIRSGQDLKRKISKIGKINPRKKSLSELHVILKVLPFRKIAEKYLFRLSEMARGLGAGCTVRAGPAEGTRVLLPGSMKIMPKKSWQ